ncbi:hypothetical protein [Cellvibrio mixtus]|uniref:hypothetical protein n=1 Tax=Cellvibrio mixtus TaxID=39650 RepID=UPI0006947764|nr:hypothetical protein [Cellvibrio mixtus]
MKKKTETTEEWFARLQADPEYVARQAEQEAKFAEKSARIAAEEKPILDELLTIGLDVDELSDFINTADQYVEAIPVLTKHMLLPYSDVIRETLARALAIPESKSIWSLLVQEYIKAPIGKGIKLRGDVEEFNLGYKSGLACALSVAVTDETLPELIELLKDKRHGESRVLLLSAIQKSKNPLAIQATQELADDPDLKIEIASWKKKQKKK